MFIRYYVFWSCISFPWIRLIFILFCVFVKGISYVHRHFVYYDDSIAIFTALILYMVSYRYKQEYSISIYIESVTKYASASWYEPLLLLLSDVRILLCREVAKIIIGIEWNTYYECVREATCSKVASCLCKCAVIFFVHYANCFAEI